MLIQRALDADFKQLNQPATAPESRLLHGVDPLLARAMVLAKVGAWSFDLRDNELSWTLGVYDLFGLPANMQLDRRQTVEMYSEDSREEMERLRAQAIAQCGAFALDAQIVRPDGGLRWMRLTGEMVLNAGSSPRLHGLKQDITEEKLRWEAMRQLAENDPITGLANRSVYESQFLNRSLLTPIRALILFDLDGFKGINDRFGHAAGDTCLRVFAERLSVSFPEAQLTARIGGDEFAMIIGEGASTELLPARVARFLTQLRAPVLWQGNMLTIEASTGIAVPNDPYFYDPEQLFVTADAALYVAKKARRRADM